MTRRAKKLFRRLRLPQRRPSGALTCAALFAVYTIIVFFAVPSHGFPLLLQRLAGLIHAILAALVAIFAIREFAGRFNTLRLPGLGKWRLSLIAGVCVFCAVFAWWLSIWAPISPN